MTNEQLVDYTNDALERAIDFLWPLYNDATLTKIAFATRNERCIALAKLISTSERVATERERERCAAIVRGRPHMRIYRQWPEITGVGESAGSQNNESYITQWCDRLAAAISAP